MFTVTVTPRDSDAAIGDPVSAQLVVGNLPPVLDSLSLDQTSVLENNLVRLAGSVGDAGVLDSHVVTIDWGDGSALQTMHLVAGETAFDASHRYRTTTPRARRPIPTRSRQRWRTTLAP